MREVVNVQLGTYANYIGAHFWNLQDEYIATPIHKRELSPSVLFREGSHAKLPYSPRLQIIDLSGGFGSLSLDAGAVLSKPPEKVDDVAWDGPAKTFRQERIPISKYISHLLEEEEEDEIATKAQNTSDSNPKQGSGKQSKNLAPETQDSDDEFGLDHGVTYWSDYSKVRLHPRSNFALPGTHFNVSNFDKFDHGTDLANSNLLDDMYDDLRFFIEDCDSLGGVHVTANASDGFSGLSSKYLTRIRDELGSSAGIFVVGAVPEIDFESQAFSSRERFMKLWDCRVAEARFMAQCIDLSVQYIPIDAASCTSAFKFVHPLQFNDYHSSAILALALDVAFSPIRLPSVQFSTGSLLNKLRYSSATVMSSLFTEFPQVAAAHSGKSDESTFHYPRDTTVNLSTRMFHRKLTAPAPQTYTWRSTRPSPVVRELVSSRGWKDEPSIHVVLDEPVTLPVAFPRFFDSHLSRDGKLRPSIVGESKPVTKDNEVEQISCLAGFATAPADGANMLRNFGYTVSQSVLKTSSRHRVEKSNLMEISEQLTGLSSDYSNL